MEKKQVAVIGGGLVGALNACFLARRGFKVDVYEYREDIRTAEHVKGRSINLALSVRGRSALRAVGLEDAVTSIGIRMYARLIHDLDGKRRPIQYGTMDQYIMSVDRRILNETLLTSAESYSNVTLHFNHKLLSCNFKTGDLVFLSEGKEVHATADVIVGNDGAFSTVRRQIMKEVRFNYSQDFIPHGYLELTCPPTEDGQYAMELNYLHIWARNEFMMIALPNLDKSFTLTLFMPFTMFSAIETEQDVMDFFQKTFPDAIPLIGEAQLKKTFLASRPNPMVSIKCSPYNVSGRVVIMGDAAHAMVPFYGQGMNCGFEDCLVLDEMLNRYNNDFDQALPAYTDHRGVDAMAMCDLAIYNYYEMRKSVNSRLFLMRKKLDNFLYWLMPSRWVPLYTSVSFSRIRYHECIERREKQDMIISRTLFTLAAIGGIGAGALLWRMYNHHSEAIVGLLSYIQSELKL